MAEQQLVDYIKKAKQGGQSDEQSKALLLKNGWTEAEVSDAFAVLSQPQGRPQTQVQTQAQAQVKPQSTAQTQPQYQPQPRVQQQPQTRPAQNNVMDNMPKIKSGSHLILKLFIVLIIVVLLGGAGYFVGGQYLNLPYSDLFSNIFAPKPETVISKMMTNMSDVKTIQSNIQGSINITDKQSVSQGKALIGIDSKNDTTNANSPKTDATLTIQITLPGSTSSMSANINIISINNKFYIKINDLTLPAEASYPRLDISQIKGRFFEVDQNSINQLSQSEGTGIDITQVNNLELGKKIQDLLLAKDMFTVSKQLNSQVVSGQNTYHYLANISKDKIKDLINKIITSQTQDSGTDNSNFLIMSMAQSYVNSFVDTIGDVNVELWIGKSDYMLYGFKIEKSVDLSKTYPETDRTITVKIDIANSNFGKAVSVQAPTSVEKIEDVLSLLIDTQGVPSDLYKIKSLAESIFSTTQNYSTLCNHGLLNGYQVDYGSDLINLNNDVVGLGGKKLTCLADSTDFCVSTQLQDGSFLCIDKNGTVQNSKCTSAKDSCLSSL